MAISHSRNLTKYIHINQHIIKRNAKTGERNPVVTVKTYKSNTKCNQVKFTDGIIKYSPDKPLSCGAKVWIETFEPVEIIGDYDV